MLFPGIQGEKRLLFLKSPPPAAVDGIEVKY
jgi:hypothetical protein